MGPTDIDIYYDEKRTPKYFIMDKHGKIVYESNSEHEVIKFAIQNHYYAWSFPHPYRPKY